MNFTRHQSPTTARGFALVHLMLVLVIILAAALLASTLLGRARQHARLERCGAELQAFAAAFEQFHAENGHWPATGAGVKGLANTAWPGPTPLGGHYGWIPPPGPERAGAVTVTAFVPDLALEFSRADLLELDRHIDDGNLATGRLRSGFNGWPVYLVEEKP
jgi:type II secretory pathway pseudopilin PulG